MSNLEIKIPDSVLNEAKKLAEQDQISLDYFVSIAVVERVSAMRGLALLRERAELGKNVDIRALLDKVPNVPPMPGDELE